MIKTLARALVSAGVETHVAATDDNGHGRLNVPLGQPVVEDGVTYWYFPRQGRFYTFSWPLTRWLAQHLQEYDLIHIHALFSYAAIPAAYWASRCGVPYVVRPLGVLKRWGMQNRRRWLKKISLRLIESRILAGAALVHYTSEEERQEAAESVTVARSVIIPNAVDLSTNSVIIEKRGLFRARYPQLIGRTLIVFLSRLDPIKGLDLLLPAFAKVRERHPRATLVMAGTGERAFVARLQREASRLGIELDIVWADFVSGEEKWALLADADLFVLPSYSENFGVAAVEAMASGVPVVVSDQVGIHREIAEANAGLVVRCEAGALANAVIRLVGDAELRSRMGANGRHLSRAQFSPEAVAARLIQAYTSIAKPALSEAAA
ncbi:MAG: glycosyltransferase [Deltaproteobacteria bacterium]|nr:glycosyltransferase [Deltaproteobacteria bacterium]